VGLLAVENGILHIAELAYDQTLGIIDSLELLLLFHKCLSEGLVHIRLVSNLLSDHMEVCLVHDQLPFQPPLDVLLLVLLSLDVVALLLDLLVAIRVFIDVRL
jgi:hypothetical protein